MSQNNKEGKSPQDSGRIIYYDPNDAFGEINGVPLTPDYSEMCIAFDLVVEMVNRFRSNGLIGENGSRKFKLSWRSPIATKPDGERTEDYMTFLRGNGSTKEDGGYLTTYYTDVSFDDLRADSEGVIVEGLGVESIQVAFESYYAPTVSIKFVDYRGSAVFAREELVHNNDEITSDTIFGCFFTCPYPKFRLQMKGFFGKPVTYQLTCSSFKGNLNPSTGNFEATVTFIGYQYGILTDIPLNYLIAAPYCDYEGSSYWASRENSPEWDLGGKPMVRLYDLFRDIEDAMSDNALIKGVTNDTEDAMNDSNAEIDAISIIQSHYTIFLNSFAEKTGASGFVTTEGEHAQVLFTYKSEDIQNIESVIDSEWRTLSDLVDDFNTNHPGTQLTGGEESIFKNGIEHTAKAVDFFILPENRITSANSKLARVSYVRKREVTKYSLEGVDVQSGSSITKDMSEAIYNTFVEGNSNDNRCDRYAYLLDMGGVLYRCNDRIRAIRKDLNTAKENREEMYIRLADAKLHVIPRIGNIFKIICAHIETFAHMMYELNKRVSQNSSARTPSMLGVNINRTDVSPGATTSIPAWPMIYASQNSDTVYSIDETEDNVFGWVGDFSHNFEEEKLIRALYAASYKATGGGLDYDKYKYTVRYLPMFPMDVVLNGSPFSSIGGISDERRTISELAGYIGMRTAQIFGICEPEKVDDGLAKAIGMVDAFNFYAQVKDRQLISERILNVTKEDTLKKALYGIMLCDENYDKYAVTNENGKSAHVFETNKCVQPKVKEQRHPIYVEDGGNLQYVHYVTKEKHGILPSQTPSFKAKSFNYSYVADTDEPYFTVNSDGYKDLLYNAADDAEDVFGKDNADIDTGVFTVLEPKISTGMISRYSEMNTGEFKINGEPEKLEEIKKVLDRYWGIGKSSYGNYLSPSMGLTDRYDKIGVANLLWTNGTPKDGNFSPWHVIHEVTDAKHSATYDIESGEFKVGEEKETSEINTLCVSLLRAYTITGGRNTVVSSLFGHKMYVQQTDTSSKAYLFLLALPFNYTKTPGILYDSNRHARIEGVPYGYALGLGAILWRQKKMSGGQGGDPIIWDGYEPAGPNESAYYHNTGDKGFVGFVPNGMSTNFSRVDYSKLSRISAPEKNELIRHFEDFVNSPEWAKIRYATDIYSPDNAKKIEEMTKLFFDMMDTDTEHTEQKDKTVDMEIADKWVKALFSSFKCRGNNAFCYACGNFALHDNPNKDSMILLMRDDCEAQEIIRALIRYEVLFADAYGNKSGAKPGQYSDITVDKSNLDSYLDGFSSKLNELATKNMEGVVVSDTEVEVEKNKEIEYNRDIMVSMYRYLKNVWDKWLIAMTEDEFRVENFFNKHFRFIDMMYRDIYDRMMINCETLLDSYNSVRANKDITVFKFMGDIATDHHCMFLALPDFIVLGDDDKQKAMGEMQKIFTPMPYVDMPEPNNWNFFVFIYCSNISENIGSLNGYTDDTLNIWSCNGVDANASGSFKKSNFLSDNETRYGYNVPSFGVTFGRQNNHLFKNISVNMESPVMTSAAINTLSHIALKGAGNDHAIAYVGQDTYPVFSNYSFQCEVEMMGDAQIQPLMYFQLMNVPLWRGTYMIFNVRHTMTPGNMVTTFTGMKMANRSVNYTNAWFTKKVNYNETKNGNAASSKCGPETTDTETTAEAGPVLKPVAALRKLFDGNDVDRSWPNARPKSWYDQFIVSAEIMVRTSPNGTPVKGSVQINKHLVKNVQGIFNELLNVPGFYVQYKSVYGYDYRAVRTPGKTSNRMSNHGFGCAIDLWSKINPYNTNDKAPKTGDTSDPIRFRSFDHPVVKVFKKFGFDWGGRYGDYMHFSYPAGG